MHEKLDLKIITPAGLIYQGSADKLKFPGELGVFHVLPNHAPMISGLKKGQVFVDSGKETKIFNIQGGVVQIYEGKAIILSEYAQDKEAG
jgi:F-type H+-transporting ATPase subunit epsilon